AGERVVAEGRGWWSLLEWLAGDQPRRGLHTLDQAQSMGDTLSRIHDALVDVEAPSRPGGTGESSEETIARADDLIAFIVALPRQDDDEAAALRWLRAQRAWLRSEIDETEPLAGPTQTIHGDYHDTNVVFEGD